MSSSYTRTRKQVAQTSVRETGNERDEGQQWNNYKESKSNGKQILREVNEDLCHSAWVGNYSIDISTTSPRSERKGSSPLDVYAWFPWGVCWWGRGGSDVVKNPKEDKIESKRRITRVNETEPKLRSSMFCHSCSRGASRR